MFLKKRKKEKRKKTKTLTSIISKSVFWSTSTNCLSQPDICGCMHREQGREEEGKKLKEEERKYQKIKRHMEQGENKTPFVHSCHLSFSLAFLSFFIFFFTGDGLAARLNFFLFRHRRVVLRRTQRRSENGEDRQYGLKTYFLSYLSKRQFIIKKQSMRPTLCCRQYSTTFSNTEPDTFGSGIGSLPSSLKSAKGQEVKEKETSKTFKRIAFPGRTYQQILLPWHPLLFRFIFIFLGPS